MSTSEALGVIGAGVGFVVTGGNPQGAAIGYSLGSAVGTAVDPPRIEGPKLGDAKIQTSEVGGPIPFGYGVYSTAGNIIWSGPLKEIKKTERQGKGGPKVTTYTYTRSYAIGVCEGPIWRFLQIKRNGKVVYDWALAEESAPSGGMPSGLSLLGQIAWLAENQVFSGWIDKATLYLGDEEQLPDSTIVSYEGAGNVAPNRGLAYIVVTDEDLTDMQGAIPQYEFVVQTFQDIYLHTKLYPLYFADAIDVNPAEALERVLPVFTEGVDTGSVQAIAGSLDTVLVAYQVDPEGIDISQAQLIAGSLDNVLIEYTPDPEGVDTSSLDIVAGELAVFLVSYEEYPPEGIDTGSVSIISGTLE